MYERLKVRFRRAARYWRTALLLPLLLEIGYMIIHYYFPHRVINGRPVPPVKVKPLDAGHYESTFTNDDGTCEMFDSAGRTKPFEFCLKDGTRVRLGFCSSLRYPCDFNDGNRQVILNGQAEFEVAHNPDHPMIIKTTRFIVQALGTDVEVVDFDGDSSCETTLLSGEANVSHNGETLALKLLQQAVINKRVMFLRWPGHPERCIGWTEGDPCLEFDSVDLQTVLLRVARWYGMKVVNPDNLAGSPMTATIRLVLPLDTNLHKLELAEWGKIRFDKKGDTILVKK